MPKSGLGLEMLQSSKLLMASRVFNHDCRCSSRTFFEVCGEVLITNTQFFFLVFISAIFPVYHRPILSQIKKWHPQDVTVTSKCVQPKFSLINPFRRDRRFDFHFLPGFCKSLVNIGSTHASPLRKEGYHPYFPARCSRVWGVFRDPWF